LTNIIGLVTNVVGQGINVNGQNLLIKESALFGTTTRTRILVLLRIIEESYPRELSRLLAVGLFAIQRAVDALELDGVVATRLIGGSRRVSLNRRYYAAEQLSELLLVLAEGRPDLQEIARSLRRRPRRRGKSL
jgi:predicted transcriptional regulator